MNSKSQCAPLFKTLLNTKPKFRHKLTNLIHLGYFPMLLIYYLTLYLRFILLKYQLHFLFVIIVMYLSPLIMLLYHNVNLYLLFIYLIFIILLMLNLRLYPQFPPPPFIIFIQYLNHHPLVLMRLIYHFRQFIHFIYLLFIILLILNFNLYHLIHFLFLKFIILFNLYRFIYLISVIHLKVYPFQYFIF